MKSKSTFLGVVVLLLIIIGTIYALFIRPEHYKFNGGEAYLTPTNTYRLPSDFVDLSVKDDFIYESNKNGLIKKTMDGETVWTKSYFIDTPLMVTAGDYIAIADITGKSVFVFNTEGFIREVKESYPIIDIHINKEGFLTTIQEDEKQNFIHYYNHDGKLVIKRATRFFENGYPIDVASSPDVTKMITAYLNVSNNRLQSKITFLGFDTQYDSYSENIIGGIDYDNALVSQAKWYEDTKAMVVLDNEIVLYDCKNEPQIIQSISVLAEIIDAKITNEQIIVWYGKPFEAGNDNQGNNVVVYNHSGKVIQSLSFDENIQVIESNADSYYVITDSQIIKYKDKGREWFSSTYLSIKDFYEIDENHFILETDQGYEVLKMREK